MSGTSLHSVITSLPQDALKVREFMTRILRLTDKFLLAILSLCFCGVLQLLHYLESYSVHCGVWNLAEPTNFHLSFE